MFKSLGWIYLFTSNSTLLQLLLNPFNIFYLNNTLSLLFNLPTAVPFTRELKTIAKETIFSYLSQKYVCYAKPACLVFQNLMKPVDSVAVYEVVSISSFLLISMLFQVMFKNAFPFASKQAKSFLHSRDSDCLVFTQSDLVEDCFMTVSLMFTICLSRKIALKGNSL